VTTNGIPISININPGNKYDSKILSETINEKIINTDTIKYKNNNRYKQYLLGDSGYDSHKNIQFIVSHFNLIHFLYNG